MGTTHTQLGRYEGHDYRQKYAHSAEDCSCAIFIVCKWFGSSTSTN